MKHIIYTLACLLMVNAAISQQTPPHFPEWEAKPTMHPIEPRYYKEHAVMILNSCKVNYIFEGDQLAEYRTIHKIYKVLDRVGIEALNTYELPLNTIIGSVKARTILPNGKTYELGKKHLQVSRSKSGGFKLIFALEAVEPNAEVEVLIKDASLTSVAESYTVQYPIPVANTFFEISYPKQLSFDLKGYHGFPSAKEEIIAGRKRIQAYISDIPPLEREANSFYNLYRMRVDYRLSNISNRVNQKIQEFGWNEYAEELYNDYYSLTRKDSLAASKFLSTIGIKGDEQPVTLIRKIEDGIKTNIDFIPYLESRTGATLDSVVSRRAANEEGIIKLFAACFRQTGLQHQIGSTTDRSVAKLELKFPNQAFLSDQLFYFPATGKYLAPLEVEQRYPLIPWTALGNKGVFCNTDPSRGFNFGKREEIAQAEVRQIPITQPDKKTEVTNTILNFDAAMQATAEVTAAYTGYQAVELKEVLFEASKIDMPKILMDYLPLAERKDRILKYSTDNLSFSDTKNPATVNATVFAPQITEKAGKKYLLKVGNALGEQVNFFYQPKPRVLPVDFKYPTDEVHTVVVNLPKGCKVENLDALNKYAEHTDLDDGHVTAYFKSSYTLVGSKLTVTVAVSYTRLHYPVREFESIKSVINAWSDFKETSILLTPSANKREVKKAVGQAALTAKK